MSKYVESTCGKYIGKYKNPNQSPRQAPKASALNERLWVFPFNGYPSMIRSLLDENLSENKTAFG